MDKILIGKIVTVVGLKGELKILNYSEQEDPYKRLKKVFIGGAEYHVERSRAKGNTVVLKAEEVNDRDGAEALRGKDVYMDAADLRELPKGTFYIRDLIGMEVHDISDISGGARIGVLKDVLTDRPQDIYVVKLDQGGECMIPGVKTFLKGIDADARVINVELIPGMIDQAE